MNNERGIVLVIVLWTMMVLMVLAAELSMNSRLEGRTTNVYQHDVAAYYLATAGVHRAMYQVLRAQQQGQNLFNLGAGGQFGQARGGMGQPPGGQGQPNGQEQEVWLRGDGRWKKEELGAGGFWVRVIDEGGKINLNQVDEATLRQAFTHLGFEQKHGELLTNTILDWRDTDPLARLNSVESDFYQGLPVPYPAKDGPFDSVEELLLVHGITPAMFFGKEGPALRQIFTVYAGGGGSVNLITANPLVLRAVLGVDAETAQGLVRQRTEATGANISGIFPGGGAGRGLNFGLPQIVTVESVGYLNDSKTTRRVSAVVQKIGVNGFRFLRWTDRVDNGEPVPTEGQ